MKIATPSLALFFSITAADAAISLDGSSSSWISLGDNFDFNGDQGTGIQASDIVGNDVNPGLFTAFDDAGTPSVTDGFIAFRVRMNTPGNGTDFTGNVWFGIDADLSGSIDAFIGVTTQGQTTKLGIYDAGDGANTSPSTTTIASLTAPYTFTVVSTPNPSANYDFRAVTAADGAQAVSDYGGDGDPDYYLSCVVSFSSLVNFITANTLVPGTNTKIFNAQNPFDQNSQVRYVVATSNQINRLNQDLGGIDNDNFVNTETWENLGGFSNTVTVPEVSSTLLALIGSVFGLVFHRRR